MPNSYEYKVVDMLRDSNDIVISAAFTIKASDGVDEYTHGFNTAFRNNPETPTPFEEITEAKVIEWIKKTVGEQSEQQADAELAAFKERKSVKSGTPW